MKPLYTEVFTLKISSTQKRTLEKLKSRNIKVSDFVRKAQKVMHFLIWIYLLKI